MSEPVPADAGAAEPVVEVVSPPKPAPVEANAQPMIMTRNLTKRYGKLLALDNLSMTLPAGEMLGLIGPNGAGKTTTLKILATLLRQTHGEAVVDGCCVQRQAAQVRERIGYMPDFCGVYDDMRVREYLHFFAATYGLSGSDADGMVDDVLELTDLVGKADAMADSLSRGMQQRLQLARVLLHDPKVLLLDEPASGLDPRARIEMRQLLKELGSMGKTIIISSHILVELAEVCSSIAIMEQGRLLYQGNVAEALRQTKSLRALRILIGVEDRVEEARLLLVEQEGVKNIDVVNDLLEVEFEAGWTPSRVSKLLHENGYRLTHLEDERVSLEDAFLHLTKGRVS